MSIALVGNAAEIEPAWAAAGERFDLVTDQTSAHDALGGYVPAEIALADALTLRATQPEEYERRSRRRWPPTCGRCSRSSAPARSSSTTATTCAPGAGGRRRRRVRLPGVRAAFIRPQFCEGRGPFRWAALSGDPADIARTDRAVLELFPDDAGLRRWIEMAQARVPFQGLPARICWLGYGERARPVSRSTSWSHRRGQRPIVIGPRPPRRRLRRLTEPRDRGDGRRLRRGRRLAAAQRPGQHAAGASWVSIHHGGGVGIGYSQHAGMVVVADGTPLAAQKLERVLTTDPAMGVLRHVDAGYDRAIEVARERGVRVPMLEEG